MNIKGCLSKRQVKSLYRFLDLLPDKWVVCLQYMATLNRFPNLKKPKRFTEKLQWYKLNYRVPLMTQCADKFRVRDYLRAKGYEEYVAKLYQACDVFEEIDFSSLPDEFVIKANNGCGTNIFVTDKSKLDLPALAREVASWGKVNTISVGREWAYTNIVPKIVVEELLVSFDDTQQNDLNDYKVLCFNGEPKVVWADVDRHIDHRRNFYDLEWNDLYVLSDCPNAEQPIPKPFGLEKMLEIAKDIASDFPFVRVDFYSVNQKVYIGELTFYPWSGCVQYQPDEFDFRLGGYFTLPPVTRSDK
ncbi:MAG: hypothetical protein IJO06_09170 [Thermoguttaceae bacterium]|nr:hypothetical protein [Thermoguttaceae bacterium]